MKYLHYMFIKSQQQTINELRMVVNGQNNRVMEFTIMYPQANSIIALYTEHQLTFNCEAFNHAAIIFVSHHLMYLNTLYLSTPKCI